LLRIHRSLVVVLISSLVSLAPADDSARHRIDIAANSAEVALKELSAQTGRQIDAPAGALANVRTREVKGEHTVATALDLMLAGTGLVANVRGAGEAISIQRAVTPNAGAAARRNPDDSSDGVVLLSEFQVSTSTDKGYRATNSISGTRLNTPIKDVPMPIEVITEDLIRDIGATSLREALTYSAGVVLESQSDFQQSTEVTKDQPYGSTASKEGTVIKLRGFVTSEALRNGFKRNSPSDALNISRVEVVRGPAALLYGTGNFGGIVNYISKKPSRTPGYEVRVAAGTEGFQRFEADATGPLGNVWNLAYRLTTSVDERDDWTDHKGRKTHVITPAFQFQPTARTNVLVEAEFGGEQNQGTGFQRIRNSLPGQGLAVRRNLNWFPTPGIDHRTFR
jgi:outer membrane receptor protein involved in Fe transport